MYFNVKLNKTLKNDDFIKIIEEVVVMKLRSIISLFSSLAILLSMSIPVYAGYGENTVAFSDVPSNFWAKDQIDYFTQQGIINGYNDGSFHPNDGVTREEFCKLLVSTFNHPLEKPETPTFSDVPTNRWSYSYVEVCRDFLTGYANPFGGMPSFHPTEYATREDIAVALVRMMGLTDNDVIDSTYAMRNFSDGNLISPNLAPYVSLACEKGLISGYPDGSFGPANSITRAETVVLLNRVTKQPVKTIVDEINEEVSLSANVLYSDNGKTATVNIASEEGASVTVNGEAVAMSYDFYGKYSGSYVYEFTEEGTKEFYIEASKGNKTNSVQVTAEYKIGAPTLNITKCPTTSDISTIEIAGRAEDVNDIYPKVSINGEDVDARMGYFQKEITLEEGSNTITIVATNRLGKSTTVTKKVEFNTEAPEITITKCPTTSERSTITIEGRATDKNNRYITATLNGQSLYTNALGYFQEDITLEEGSNTITITATNSYGKSSTVTRKVEFGVKSPKITIKKCPTTSDKSTITIEGQVDDSNDGYLTVTINGQSVNTSGGNFEKEISLKEGSNTITIVATNKFGKSTTVTREVEFGADAPVITITNCPTTSSKDTVTIEGKVKDTNDSYPEVTVNGESVYVYYGSWSKDVSLQEGTNTITIKATNKLGKSTTETRKIEFGLSVPKIKITSCPSTSNKETVTIEGKVEDNSDDRPDVTVNGESVYVYSNGEWSTEISLDEGSNTVNVVATNSYGMSSEETRKIEFSAGNPKIQIINCPESTTKPEITIKGRIKGNSEGAMLFINDEEFYVDYDDTFSVNFDLTEGENVFDIRVVNDYGKEDNVTKTVTYSPKE